MKTSDEFLSWRSVVKGGVFWGGLGAFAGIILEMTIAHGATRVGLKGAARTGAPNLMMAVQSIHPPGPKVRLAPSTNGAAASRQRADFTESLRK